MKTLPIIKDTTEKISELLSEKLLLNLDADALDFIKKDLSEGYFILSDENKILKDLYKWRSQARFSNKNYTFEEALRLEKEYFIIKINYEQYYEERKIVKVAEPYYDQMASNHIDGLWTHGRKDFEEKIYQWKLRGLETISPCPNCHGTKEIRCISCSGSGRLSHKCSSCSGSGRISQTTSYSQSHGGGSSTTYVQCYRCSGRGSVDFNCLTCGGRGRLPCTYCGPTTRVFNYRKLVSELKTTETIFWEGEEIQGHKDKVKPKFVCTFDRNAPADAEPDEDKLYYADKIILSIIYVRMYNLNLPSGYGPVPVENGHITFPPSKYLRSIGRRFLNTIYLIFITIIIVAIILFIYAYFFDSGKVILQFISEIFN